METMTEQRTWNTPSRGNFTLEEMIKSIREYIEKDKNSCYQIIVGSDSQTFPKTGRTKYVTAIVVRKIGKGAQYYVKTEYQPYARSLRKKIWYEVMSIYDTINVLREDLRDIIIKDQIIPHIDVGENGETKSLIKEVTGLFLSEGYDVQIKPNSYASSTVADKHSK